MNLKWTITKFENHDLSDIRIFFKKVITLKPDDYELHKRIGNILKNVQLKHTVWL